MSPQQVPPLTQATTDFESDSEYIGTPVDPPSTCQPYVAEYGPLPDYYYHAEAYNSPGFTTAESATSFAHSGESAVVGASGHHGLMLHTAYTAAGSEGCNQSADTTIAAYHLINPTLLPPSSNNNESSVRLSKSNRSSETLSSLSSHARRMDPGRIQLPPLTLQYAGCGKDDEAYGEKLAHSSLYSKNKYRQSDLTCDPTLAYPSAEYSSYTSVGHSSDNTLYVPRSFCDEGYADSPIDDHAYCDRFPEQGCSYEQHLKYDHLTHPQPHPDTRLTSGSGHNLRLYQPSYLYSTVDISGGGSAYGVGPVSPSSNSYVYPVIHAPRPQQVSDIHTLHSNTYPSDGSGSAMLPSHRVLSIPSVPAPPPVQRPSSLIEDTPKKPLTLACFFCRKRKIACQSPPGNSKDRTCNQCAKRKLQCVYPVTSRRGIRPRVYDLADDVFRRPSAALSL